jgi:hypothetical protein
VTNWHFLTALALLGGAPPASAQLAPPPTGPSIASLAVPDNQLGDARKYFLLHKPGVSVEQAQADLSFCWRFLPHAGSKIVPGFVAWQRATAAKPVDYSLTQYGLVGDAIGAIIAGPLERSMRQSRIFRCMVPRGYARYRTSEAIWKQLNTGDAAQSIRLQAQIAAGPVPPTPQVLP